MARNTPPSDHVDLPSRAVSDETILKMTKEIAVKFIEVGRITPSTFNETFKTIHQTIEETVRHHD